MDPGLKGKTALVPGHKGPGRAGAAFLAGHPARYISGSTIRLHGGSMRSP